MTTHCFIPVLGKRIRVTELDLCGAVPVGAEYIATDGFVTANLSSEVEDGVEIIQKNASGALCVNEKKANSFKRFNVEIEFCGVNPSLLAMVSNAEPYADYDGDIAGFTVAEGEINKNFAFELWTGLSGMACLPGQTGEASGYILLPYVKAGVLGDIAIDGENAVTFSLTGSSTSGGNAWGVGPYNVVVGPPAANEVQTLTTTGTPAGGTIRLNFDGQQTGTIAYNASAAVVQSALEALSNIAPGDVVVTGGPLPAGVVITFGGTYAGVNVPLITTTGTALTGGTSPTAVITQGVEGAPGVASKLPTALDPYDHLLMMDTAVAPPPVACSPTAVV